MTLLVTVNITYVMSHLLVYKLVFISIVVASNFARRLWMGGHLYATFWLEVTLGP
jgi:hypothetical protein